MLRSNFMNGLMALVAVGLVLTGYNAFIADSDDGSSASQQLAEYLNLDAAELEPTPGAVSNVAVDSSQEDATVNDEEETVTVEETNDDEMVTSDTTESETKKEVATAAGSKPETVYTVKEGDTYGCIAEKYYGSFEHFIDVMNANPTNQVGFSELGLHVGARVVLPAIDAANLKPASSLCN